MYYDPELIKQKKTAPSFSKTRHLLVEKSRGGYAGRQLHVTRDAFSAVWQWMDPHQSETSPIDVLTNAFRSVTDDEWRAPSEWMTLLDLQFNERSLRRYLDRLVGSVLECEERRSEKIRNRTMMHYRPRQQVRTSARQMLTSKGDGINVV